MYINVNEAAAAFQNGFSEHLGAVLGFWYRDKKDLLVLYKDYLNIIQNLSVMSFIYKGNIATSFINWDNSKYIFQHF